MAVGPSAALDAPRPRAHLLSPLSNLAARRRSGAAALARGQRRPKLATSYPKMVTYPKIVTRPKMEGAAALARGQRRPLRALVDATARADQIRAPILGRCPFIRCPF